MKKIRYLLLVTSISVLVVIVGCDETKNLATSPSGIIKEKKEDSILFKEVYNTNNGYTIKYTDSSIFLINFFIDSPIEFSSKLFSDNFEVREDGKVYILNKDLDKLKILPAGSIGRVIHQEDIVRNKGVLESIVVTFTKEDIQYLCRFKKQSYDNYFLFKEIAGCRIVYQGVEFDDPKGKGVSKLKYCVIDPPKN